MFVCAGGAAVGVSQTPAMPDLPLPAVPQSRADATIVQQDSKRTEDDKQRVALPASRIINIVQGNPEVLVELKSFIADSMLDKGAITQSDSMSDEEVYRLIVTNAELRARITDFLRARGYVSDEEIDRASESTDLSPRDTTFGAGTYGRLDEMTDPDLMLQNPTGEISNKSGNLRRSLQRSDAGIDGKDRNNGEAAAPHSNVTDRPEALHRPAPYNLLSLRDLYTQIPNTEKSLKRFGSEMFVNRNASPDELSEGRPGGPAALDVPVGPDYVLGPGDTLSIVIWGGISQSLKAVIDREGRITLPEAGQLQVAGLTLEHAEQLIQSALQVQFRNAHVAVTVGSLRSIRIYVVGDVQRPGAYDISSLASPINALYAAGGPTAIGSLRLMRHYRSEKLIGQVDLYDFMLHGVRGANDHLQGGDTLVVPPVGPQVAVSGAVKRPAIYELDSEKTLDSVLAEAGGVTVAAALGHITIERIVANQRREVLSVEVSDSSDPAAARAKIAQFEVKDGDRIRVDTLLPYSERVVYLQGHVVRPGKTAYRDGLRMSDVLKSYADLLPEPADMAEIVRLAAPDLHPETIEFNVPDVLIGNANLPLQPFDTIRIFGRYEQDAPTVTVKGEVQRPGSYPLFSGMTAAQLVRAAGGFKRDALLETADLVSYKVIDGAQVTVNRRNLEIGSAVLKDDRAADAPLKPGDILTVHQLTGWNDIGASITIEGEVAHPGSYGLQEGERLSDVLKRAGGFRSTAYPEGAVLTRPDVAALEEKSRQELVRQIEASSAAARLSPAVAGSEQSANLLMIQQQQDQVLSRLRSQSATGRLVIHIDPAIESWAGTPADIEVRSGDKLRIPKRPGFVLVTGQVYNASAISFVPGKSASWYLDRAGGSTAIANRGEIFVIRANGTVVGRRSGGWRDREVLSTRLNAGDVIVVPQKIIGTSLVWRNLLSAAQIAASISIAAAVAGL